MVGILRGQGLGLPAKGQRADAASLRGPLRRSYTAPVRSGDGWRGRRGRLLAAIGCLGMGGLIHTVPTAAAPTKA